jgi:hypothetical protein
MSDRNLGWKYWDQVGNCWQYIDLDEFYGSDEVDRPVTAGSSAPNIEPQSETQDWPNLTIVDLLDSDHLKNNKNSNLNVENDDVTLLKSLPSRAKSRRSLPDARRTPYSDSAAILDDLSKKYDISSLNAKLTEATSAILDIPRSQIPNSPRHRSCEKTWESSLRTPLVPPNDRREAFISSSKNGVQPIKSSHRIHRKSSKQDNEKISMDQHYLNSKVWVKLVWKPRNSNQEGEKNNLNSGGGINSVSLSDQFHPSPGVTSGIIHSTNPIASTKRILQACNMKTRNGIGYTVEPITGTGVRPPAELQNFRCEPNIDGKSRPETPVEIKRLRLLPTPVVRKCMAEALKNGILEPEDTDLIMKRIKNKSTGPNSKCDEEIIKNQSKRLISPLKYVRRPRPDGGPIYKLDDSKATNSTGKKSNETEPITFKVLSKTESAVLPTHIEIPFLQKNKPMGRLRSKTWQSTLRSKAPEPPKVTKKPIIDFDVEKEIPERGSVLARPMPPPPSPIKNLFTVMPEIRSKHPDVL